MALNYLNLDARTRGFMVEEIDMAISSGSIYFGKYLTDFGKRDWPALLREAASHGSDGTLAHELALNGRLATTTTRAKPKGGFTDVAVPYTAPEMLAEGEFNRFYIRGLCRRAIEDGIQQLIVYRAKPVASPRAESERKIGTGIAPDRLLADLRTSGVDTSLGLPPGPNSGLSVCLP